MNSGRITNNKTDINYFQSLPRGLRLDIFSFLPIQTIASNCALVCRDWRDLSGDKYQIPEGVSKLRYKEDSKRITEKMASLHSKEAYLTKSFAKMNKQSQTNYYLSWNKPW